jgi:hypothetical protein
MDRMKELGSLLTAVLGLVPTGINYIIRGYNKKIKPTPASKSN